MDAFGIRKLWEIDIQGEMIKIFALKKTIQIYFKSFIEKINSGNLII